MSDYEALRGSWELRLPWKSI